MDEIEQLETKMFGAVRSNKLRPTIVALFELSKVDREDFKRWSVLKIDAILAEFLPQLDWPFWLPQSRVIPWARGQAQKWVPAVIDKYFASVG